MKRLNSKKKMMTRIIGIPLLMVLAIIILMIYLGFVSYTSTFKTLSEERQKSSAIIYGETIEGVNKNGTLNSFLTNVPNGTIFFDSSKANTINVGEEGYTLSTNGNNNIQKRNILVNGKLTNRVVYLGPNGDGLPGNTEGYVTNTGINKNASEESRSVFTMKFKDIVTMQDTSKKDVAITISNIYIINQRSEKIPYSASWTGNGIQVLGPCDDVNNNLEYQRGYGIGMHCDISISVLNDDGLPLEGEKILFEAVDLDVRDGTRTSGGNSFIPKANDSDFNQGLSNEQKLKLYDSDYRESIYILNGALSDAYMPESNWLEVKRLSQGDFANGLRFSSYENGDNATLNTGFLTLIDSKETTLRWYGSASATGMGTGLFTNTSNHKIKATSSLGGFIRTDFVFNSSNNDNLITNSFNLPEKYGSFQHNFMDGVNVPYVMQADLGHYMQKIIIDNNEFLPTDFSTVVEGESDKTVKITKDEKEYTFVVSKDIYGNVIKAEYVFENNNADHEISVNWASIPASLVVKYKEKGTDKELATSVTKNGVVGDEYNTESEKKIIENYTFVEDSGNTTGSYTMESATTPIEVIYYYKLNDYQYTTEYYYDNIIDNTKTETKQAPYGSKIETYVDKNIDGYRLEKQEGLPLTISNDVSKNVIKIYYVKRNDLTYKVYYKEEGTEKELATAKEGKNQTYGTTVTENAIDIAGYTKNSPTSANIQITTGTNEYTFYYKKRNDLTYKVYYKEEGTEKELATAKEGKNQTYGTTVTENAIDIDGYTKVAPTSASIEITTGTNEHTFYYKKRNDLTYKVYYKEEGTEKELATAKEGKNQTYGTTVTENAIDITGYAKIAPTSANIQITTGTNEHTFYYKKRTDLSYTVYYLEKGSNKEIKTAKEEGNQELGKTITSASEVITIDGYKYDSADKESIQITAGTNEIKLYYVKRNDLTYKVYYKEEGTEKELATAKEGKNQTYGTTVTENAIDIDGYTKVAPTSASIEITTGTNEHTFYYKKRNDLTYKVYYKEEGTEKELATAKEGKNQTYGATVTENAIDIDGYTKIAPTSAQIQITTGTNEHTFYYKKRTDLSYKVYYLEKDSNKEIKTAKEVKNQTYKDVIETNKEVIEIPKYNYDSCDKSSIIIDTDLEKNIIKLYYKKKNTGLVIKYIDEFTGKEIATRETETGKIDDSYATLPKNIEGYDLSRDSGNTSGKFTEDEIEVIYYYKAKSNVIIKYIDKIAELDIIDQEVIDGNEGDTYKTEAKEYKEQDISTLPFKDYILVKEPENKEGTMTKDTITLKYYYAHKSAGIAVNHLDIKTNLSVADQETKSGKEGDSYTTHEKDVGGYDLVTDRYPENANGKMTKELITVNYYYIKKTKVTAKYIDKNSNKEIADPETINGHEGDDYTTETKNIKNYVLVGEPLNKQGTMTTEPIEVIFYYVQISAGVIEKHIDEFTNELLGSETYQGNEGDSYTTSAKTFEGYELDNTKLPNNATGTMTKDVIEVKYYYKYKTGVNVKYVDKITGEEIVPSVLITGYEGDEYKTEKKEYKENKEETLPFKDYTLTEVPENANGEMTKEPINVVYYYTHNSAGVKVNYLDIRTNEPVARQDKIEGHEGDDYTTHEKDVEGYDLVTERYPSNATGKMARQETVVNYYYIKKAKVTVKYIDKITGKELTDDVVIKGHEGDDYETEQKSFDGYTLEKVPENVKGTIEKDDITVIYNYVHNSAGVKVNHFDVMTGDKLTDEEIIEGQEGDKYETKEKSFEGYGLVKDRYPENAKGKMTIEETKVNYYYIHKSKVTTKYIDKETGEEISEKEIKEGHVGESYETEEKKIENYDIEKELYPKNPKGTMTKEDIEVIYYYKRKTEVISKYIDKETGKEIEEKVGIKGYVGNEYKTNNKEIKNYILIEEPKNKEGKMTKEPIEVIYYYRKAIFNLSIDKKVKEIQVNGKTKKMNKDIAKIEVKRKKIKDTKVKVVYTIKVTNDGEVAGSAKIEENIPKGMTMAEKDNKKWNIKGNKATITTDTIKPGEKAEYTVVLTWDNSTQNFGTKKNVVSIVETKNDAGYKEKDTKDNTDDAQLIISVSTGVKTAVRTVGIATIVLSAIGVCIVVVKRRNK